MIGARGRGVAYAAEGRRSVAERRRIDIVEAGPAIPEWLPARMRPVGAQESGVRDERALDGIPGVEILGFVERPDECGGQEEEEQTVDEPGPPAPVAACVLHDTWYRRCLRCPLTLQRLTSPIQ